MPGTPRGLAGVRQLQRDPDAAGEGQVVTAVERALGRRVPPFDVEFVVVPVRDRQVRRLTETRYLVPEAVYGTPDWAGWLTSLIFKLSG